MEETEHAMLCDGQSNERIFGRETGKLIKFDESPSVEVPEVPGGDCERIWTLGFRARLKLTDDDDDGRSEVGLGE